MSLRKITVDEQNYFWAFSYRRNYVCKYSLTLINELKTQRFSLHFLTKDNFTAGAPFNEGLPMLKNGEVFRVNLNRPFYASQILKHILITMRPDSTAKLRLNGNQILMDMGYEDIENYLLKDNTI